MSIAFLKKICRQSKTNIDKFRDLASIIGQIENGHEMKKVKS